MNNPDSGSATEELGVDFEADPIEIGFNAKYLLDIGAQLRSGTAVFKLADPGSPTLIEDNERRQRALRADADAGLTRRAIPPEMRRAAPNGAALPLSDR